MPTPQKRLFAQFDSLPQDQVPGAWLRHFGYEKAEKVYAAALAEWLNPETSPDFSPVLLCSINSALNLRALAAFKPKRLCVIDRENRLDLLLTGKRIHLLLVIRLFHWIKTDWSACAELGVHEPREGRVIKVALSMEPLKARALRSAGFVPLTFQALVNGYFTGLGMANESFLRDSRAIEALQLFDAAMPDYEARWSNCDAFGRGDSVE